MERKNQDTFWNESNLLKKVDLFPPNQVRSFFVPFLDIKSNELIYDIGSGYSPLGSNFIPYIMPNGLVKGFDHSTNLVDAANTYAREKNLLSHLTFHKADVYTIDEQNLPFADLVMCQQLLVNLPDPVTAIEHMLNITKSTGRLFCLENVNYGAYIHRPDFSWKTNLELSHIWQEICIIGKNGFDYGDTTFGANLPQIFDELGLYDISWQIISSGINVKPPYTIEFKEKFLKNLTEEKMKLKELILTKWAPKTDLPEKKIQFFIDQIVVSDYDKYAVEHDLFLTQWFYPMMAIVGWLNPRPKHIYSEEISLDEI